MDLNTALLLVGKYVRIQRSPSLSEKAEGISDPQGFEGIVAEVGQHPDTPSVLHIQTDYGMGYHVFPDEDWVIVFARSAQYQEQKEAIERNQKRYQSDLDREKPCTCEEPVPMNPDAAVPVRGWYRCLNCKNLIGLREESHD